MRTITQNQKTSTLTTTEAAILGLVAGGELSGYDLQRRISKSVGYFWRPARSQIYVVLPRLVERGFALSRTVHQGGRPDKHLYRITPDGLAALREWLEQAPLGPDPEPILLIKVFFGRYADPEVIRGFVQELRAEAERLQRELAELDATADGDRFHALTRTYGMAISTAIIDWALAADEELT
jgi:DNA-binding PadR family transcriptional regulator